MPSFLNLPQNHMFEPNSQEQIKHLLCANKKVVVVSHTNPDGDAIGSIVAMYHYLKKLDVKVDMMVPNKFPEFYDWIPGSDKIVIYEKQTKLSQQLLKEADLVIALDFNSLQRLGTLKDIVEKVSCEKMLIDHHIDPDLDSFNYAFTTVDTSSTAELVFQFICLMGHEHLIDKQIGQAIYAGIVTDTGSYSFSCNRPETYLITAKLVSLGVDAERIHKLIYDTFSENRLRLLGYAISERMIVWSDLHTALIYLTKDDLTKYNYQVGDTEGLVNYPLSMKGINVSVLITEKDNQLRLSFRSKGSFSVNDLSRKYFNGGGHKNAAGGRTNEDVNTLINRLKTVLNKYKESLGYTIEL